MEKNEYKDILFEIADAVTMQDVLNQYGFHVRRQRGRIPCPFHNGKDENLGYSEHKFSCFVCGTRGNPVSFVARLFEESNSKAAQRIDKDFGLNMFGREMTFAEHRALERKRLERLRKIEAAKELSRRYIKACDRLHSLERIIQSEIADNAESMEISDYLASIVHLKSETEAQIEELWEEMKYGT